MTIRVLIADDHNVVAEGLRHLLQAHPDIEVVGTANNGRDAVRRAIELDPEVVLMDSNMPDLNGIEATRIIRERAPRTRVLMLSVLADPFHIVRALRAGASGYVPKNSAGSEVIDAIREVHRGRRYLHASVAQDVLERLVDEEPAADPLLQLSSRELQVLQMMAEGKSVSHIARSFSLSVRTVETYRSRMMDKLDIHDMPSLVKFAIVHGLTSLH
jgi:DNA-binding NarL/FixJ family response regulator